jgi:hypothetical protein
MSVEVAAAAPLNYPTVLFAPVRRARAQLVKRRWSTARPDVSGAL